jgi:hypothetical protein
MIWEILRILNRKALRLHFRLDRDIEEATIGEYGLKVVPREVRIVFEDLFFAPSGGFEAEQKLDRNPRALDPWTTAANIPVGNNSFVPIHNLHLRTENFDT